MTERNTPDEQDLADNVPESACFAEQAEELTARLGHDLRGLLNSVLGYAELLSTEMAGQLNPRQRHFVDIIRREAQVAQVDIDRSIIQFNRLIQTTFAAQSDA